MNKVFVFLCAILLVSCKGPNIKLKYEESNNVTNIYSSEQIEALNHLLQDIEIDIIFGNVNTITNLIPAELYLSSTKKSNKASVLSSLRNKELFYLLLYDVKPNQSSLYNILINSNYKIELSLLNENKLFVNYMDTNNWRQMDASFIFTNNKWMIHKIFTSPWDFEEQ